MLVTADSGICSGEASPASRTVNVWPSAPISVPQRVPAAVSILIIAGGWAGSGGAHHHVPMAATKSSRETATSVLALRSWIDAASAQATSNWRTPPYLVMTSARLSLAGVPAAACSASHRPAMAARSPPSASTVSTARHPVARSLAASGPLRSSPPVARVTKAASPVRHFSAAAWVAARLCSLRACQRLRSRRLSGVGPAAGLRYLGGGDGGLAGGTLIRCPAGHRPGN